MTNIISIPLVSKVHLTKVNNQSPDLLEQSRKQVKTEATESSLIV